MKLNLITNSECGFTFVELLITMGVVVFALLGLMTTNAAIQQNSEVAFERSMAVQDANQVLEQIRDSSATGTFPQNVTTAFPNGGAVGGFASLTNQNVTVSYADTAANPLDVTVTVNWQSNGQRNATTSLRTLVTQRG